MNTCILTQADRPALEALLLREPAHNVFHLSALAETGLEAPEQHGGSWAVGAFKGAELVGALAVLRGTGGIYHTSGDTETLESLAGAVEAHGNKGMLSLVSGHSTQIDPLLRLVRAIDTKIIDRCHYYILQPDEMITPPIDGQYVPRIATEDDIERLIDFYSVGFYSLAKLPSRAAWRNRLAEQIAFRTLFLVEDSGKIVSAALSSAEAGGCAMLGGVATLHSHRARGLSTLCVGALCAHLFEQIPQKIEKTCLFYLKENKSAGRVYNKLGFKPAGEWLLAPVGLGAAFAPLLRGL
jgi:predicted GNAT family acetyltransferase